MKKVKDCTIKELVKYAKSLEEKTEITSQEYKLYQGIKEHILKRKFKRNPIYIPNLWESNLTSKAASMFFKMPDDAAKKEGI